MSDLIIVCQSQNINLYINIATLYCLQHKISSVTLATIGIPREKFHALKEDFSKFVKNPRTSCKSEANSSDVDKVYANLTKCIEFRYIYLDKDDFPKLVDSRGTRSVLYDVTGLTNVQLLKCATHLVARGSTNVFTTAMENPEPKLIHEMPEGNMSINGLSSITSDYYTFLETKEGKAISVVFIVSFIASLMLFFWIFFVQNKDFLDSLFAIFGAFSAFITVGITMSIPLGKILLRRR